MDNIIVMKFGGSSVANASAMLNVFNIITSQKCNKLVVLSACKGVTDLLIEAANFSLQNITKSIEIINEISEHHKKIIENTINSELKWKALEKIDVYIRQIREFSEGIHLLQELTAKMMDFFVSFGEKLSTTVFYYILLENKINAVLINSENYIITNSKFGEAEPNYSIIKLKVQNELKPEFDKYDTIIAQGFIGSDLEGRTTTLGRGGSDFSASIYGLALGASEIQIWTDVSGVKSADPRIVEQAITIDEMTIDDIRELSFYGAKVLHPDTIKPAIEAGIPIKVLNTF
ncbi:MAG TPA: aspartate kinase, partial [Candidatus Kapabacteria bacterium]|nr:aspartate kinase [Candidatus Kapabacteria bacterium]